MISVLVVSSVWILSVAVYRLWLHPLRKFPGRRLAALTSYYGFYHNTVKDGSYIWEIEKMHQDHGPVVRIGPNEVHISDPQYFGELHSGIGRAREPGRKWIRVFATAKQSLVATINHEVHLSRRNLLQKHFTKNGVSDMEPQVQVIMKKLQNRFDEAARTSEVINLETYFSAMGTDVVSEMIFGTPTGCLDDPKMRNHLRESISSMFKYSHTVMQFPLLVQLQAHIPTAMVRRILPSVQSVFNSEDNIRQRCKDAMTCANNTQPTIIQTLNHKTVPESERTLERIKDEAMLLLIGGTETAARTLAVTIFHMISNPLVWEKLRNEVTAVYPASGDPPSFSALDRLPYLRAVINEGLRMSPPSINPLPVVAPNEALKYNEWTIPPGTVIGQSAYFVNFDSQIFPNPERFDPDRWIRAEEKGDRLENNLATFSKGIRGCIGKNLAYAEMSQALALVVHRYQMKLYQTTIHDVALYKDYVSARAIEGSQGVRVVVQKLE